MGLAAKTFSVSGDPLFVFRIFYGGQGDRAPFALIWRSSSLSLDGWTMTYNKDNRGRLETY